MTSQIWSQNPLPQQIGAANGIADGGSDVFRAGKRLFGEDEHAGESADADANDGFATVKIGLNIKTSKRGSVEARQRDGGLCAAAERRGAFTLIEMILAIGIAAIVLICANMALFTSLHLRDAAADTVDAESPVDSAVTFLKRDLECCVTPTNGTSKVLSGGFRAGNGITSVGVSGDGGD